MIDKLLFDDVRAAEGLTFDGKLGGGVFTTRDGLTVTLELAAAKAPEDLPWVRVAIDVADDAPDEARALAETARAQTVGRASRGSAERRGGEEWGTTCSTRWAPGPHKKT